ncbi:transcription repressor OFP13-like [Cornus florida]|uniref:transcription repressor OFP13-like n=1 Tax=Cornus florida TaxID=4283 RepID=UPI00289DE4B1|nr:transcription repressor OFP13-like [Cornus florida]
MKLLPFPFKNTTETTPSWPWRPSCGNPKTLSFRAGDNMYKTINSAYVDDSTGLVDSPESSSFTNVFESTTVEHSQSQIETVIRGLRSERLFFEAGAGESSSIMEEAKTDGTSSFVLKESVVMEMESHDPYLDFKKSMEEMVEAHGLNNWDRLEELLSWYLRVNGKSNHGYIVQAFVDLLINRSTTLATFASPNSSTLSDDDDHHSFSAATTVTQSLTLLSFSSSSSSPSTTPCLSSLEAEDDIQKTPLHNVSSSSSSLDV